MRKAARRGAEHAVLKTVDTPRPSGPTVGFDVVIPLVVDGVDGSVALTLRTDTGPAAGSRGTP
ncbi:MAG: hypothetical protein NVS4B3_28360 [Gemmatimonadaceae bacterium]